MKTYEAKFDPIKNKGVYGISLVENPAMEGLFIALSKQTEIQLKEVDLEQRILMGLVLEPNKPIYRNQNGEEFNIVFNEQTIKDLSYNFFKSNNHSNSTIEHDVKHNIQGVTFTESWIVENTEIDKSANFGFSYPKGSWIAIMKVDSDEVWSDYVKTGKVKGFSIDAMLSLEEVKLSKNQTVCGKHIWFADSMILKGSNVQTLDGKNLPDGKYELMTNVEIEVINGEVLNLKQINMNSISNTLEKILLALSPKKDELIKLGSAMLADGSLKIEWEGETLSEGISVYVMAEDGTKVPVPVGDHPLEDGTILVVETEGIAKEIKQANAPVDAAETDGKVSNDAKIASEIESAIKSILIKYEAQEKVTANLTQELSEVKKQNEILKSEVVELGKQPAVAAIKSTPVQLSYNELSNVEKVKRNRGLI